MKMASAKALSRNRIAMACGTIAVALLAGGCAGMMKQLREEMSDEKVEFRPVYKAKFDARREAAATSLTPTELESGSYVRLGELSVKFIDKRCFPKDGCSSESHSELPTSRLLREAAQNGGDTVVLGRNNNRGKGQAVKNGRCLSTKTVSVPRSVCDYETICSGGFCSTRQTICHTEYSSQEQCAQWEQIYGDEYYTSSDASVWRRDPELLAQVRFGDSFFEAIRRGDVSQVKTLTAKGMRPDIYDLRGRYPLLAAVQANSAPIATFMLQKGARADVENSRALVTATEKDNGAIVALLLEHGADPNAKIGLWTALTQNTKTEIGKPLVNAVQHNNLAMARTLLQHKADPDVMDGEPLKRALSNPAMVELLLANGANVGENGILTDVVKRNDPVMLRSFLAKGADPDNREWTGQTPLQAAAEAGNVEIMKLLLDAGASVDKRGVGGAMTPLMYAAQNGRVEAVRLLLGHGADVTVTDIPTGVGWLASLAGLEGKTALSLARAGSAVDARRKQDYETIVKLLAAAEAKR